MRGEPLRIAMVAGEASGDLLGSHLIQALGRHVPDARFFGIGGPKMESAGFDSLWPSEKLAVRGIVEVLGHLPSLLRIRHGLTRRLLHERPQVFIGIDAPDFNLGLEAKLKRRGIPTVHYVSPQIWAWRSERIDTIAASVSHMLALFPFEAPLYEKRGVPVTYVGHPLADMIPLEVDQGAARERLFLPKEQLIFAMLPGSRQSEIDYMGGLFIQTARKLLERFPESQFLVPFVSRETRDLFEQAVWTHEARELPIKLLFGHAQDALAACDAVLAASGTATLEAALFKRPMVISYRVSRITAALVRRMGEVRFAGLPNILAGEYIVPEFLQEDATPENLAQALGNLISDSVSCERLLRVYDRIHRSLRQNTSERAAQAVLPFLRGDPAWTAAHQPA
jgi:lipid-A-disaccharide synthase